MEQKTVKRVLEFWFGDMKISAVPDNQKQKMWWIKDKDLDERIKIEFENDLLDAKSMNFDEIGTNKDEILAYVILLDQFSRNIYRDTPAAFAQDEIALNIVIKGLIAGIDKNMLPFERAFFYMPLMHSEDVHIQKKSLDYFTGLESEYNDHKDYSKLVVQNKKYAILHYEIIEKFGRYPHRNSILGRQSTPEELEFLKGPGSSF